MERLYIIIGILGVAALLLALRQILLCCSLRELIAELQDILSTDTNRKLTVSTGNRQIRSMANALNAELSGLRAERLRLKCGNQELKNAVTGIAHDLRTPLTAISGYIELLEIEDKSEKAADYIDIIRERTQMLTTLSEDLFRYSLAVDTADNLVMSPVSLNAQIGIALAGAYAQLKSKNIAPHVSMPDNDVIRSLDEKALQRVLNNILNNAARYSKGDLHIDLNADGCITFSNYAPELSQIDVGRLFDRFYTVENARGSTGLGLSIARLLTEKMGGRIEAEYAQDNLTLRITFRETRAQ